LAKTKTTREGKSIKRQIKRRKKKKRNREKEVKRDMKRNRKIVRGRKKLYYQFYLFFTRYLWKSVKILLVLLVQILRIV
jgi:hypothetical protein